MLERKALQDSHVRKPKRWQLSVRGLMLLTFLATIPFGLSHLSQPPNTRPFVFVKLCSACTFFGMFTGIVAWMIFGTPRGFWCGYSLGALMYLGLFLITNFL